MADFVVPPLEHTPWPTPSRAIYGFVLYVTTYVIFGCYFFWGLLPDEWLHAIGLTYLPARHWVITFPFLFCFVVAAVYTAYVIRIWSNFRSVSNDTQDDFTDLDTPVAKSPTKTNED